MPGTSPPALTDRFLSAVALAEEVHGGARREGTGIPYLAHLLVVTGLVLEDEGDEDEAIAAMLHDAVEDGGGRPMLARIHASFGPRVAEIVEQLSDSVDPDSDSDKPWIELKQRYLLHLQDCDDEGVLRVSLADKVNNARSLVREYREQGDALRARLKERTPQQHLWYYVRLLELFSRKRPGSMTEDLRRAVTELQGFVVADS